MYLTMDWCVQEGNAPAAQDHRANRVLWENALKGSFGMLAPSHAGP